MDLAVAQAYLFSADMLAEIIEFRGEESSAHIGRIRLITKILLEQAVTEGWQGVTPEMIEKMSGAAGLHDVGKISVPEKILLKPGRLTPMEYRIMQTHPIKGWEILNRITDIRDEQYHRYCCDICRFHHERWDGSGYPDGLVGDQSPFWAQAAALADVYDALVSKRVYKSAYPHEQANRLIIGGDCGLFGPFLLRCFAQASDRLCAELHPPRE